MAEHGTDGGVVIAHDGTEPEELGVDEPQTPAWMPLLGAVLFLCGAIAFVATRPAGKTAEELQRAAATAAAEAAAKAKPPEPPPTPAAAPGMPAPGGRPGAAPGKGG